MDELGVAVLDDLRVNMSAADIARNLADFGPVGPDGATRRLQAATGCQVDLNDAAHRLAAITWLRAWGCRHLRRADTPRTDEALRTWWTTWNGYLPSGQATLTSLVEADLVSAGQAYDALRAAPAARRSVKGTDVDVAFGDTATAKLLFAIRPQVFPPWDEAIRLAFGKPGGSAAYVRLLRLSGQRAAGDPRPAGIDAAQDRG
jgi:hypothetical protein